MASQTQTSFPVAGWERDLGNLPRLQHERIVEFYKDKAETRRCLDRSYNFFVECYVDPSSIKANYTNKSDGTVYLKASCYRSKKKNAAPYAIFVVISSADGCIKSTECSCAAGRSACNHAMAVLRTASHIQSRGFTEAPLELTCTDLPQKWRVPRSTNLHGMPLQAVNRRAVREDGLDSPLSVRLYDPRGVSRTLDEQKAAEKQLAEEILKEDPDSEFAKGLLEDDNHPYERTKWGLASVFAPLSYQQPLMPFGFDVVVKNIFSASIDSSSLPEAHQYFSSCDTWKPPAALQDNNIVKKLCITPEEARVLERNTRGQRSSARWQEERSFRLTASNYGIVASRSKWTSKGLRGLAVCKDLSRVPAIRYGVANEPLASERYRDVMRGLGHDCTVHPCGLLVNPEAPWLGASPDGIIYD
ncbi:uncharacterized protein LOC119379518 [Rhipicephalus sanguineus]|uniref:uncharacterized protein LOC119379518 n=1 Tax=Rhipicephalus sanguineus TaxID=34632 RepID=UPI001894B4DC|nr:uncharacterized protein LOC119379518 [Rhipicephalus sanguineus]